MILRGLLVLLSGSSAASQKVCDADCRTRYESPYPNTIAGYDVDEDCAWITSAHLDKTEADTNGKDDLGECHRMETDTSQTGIIELACGTGVTIAGFTKACAETTRDSCSPQCSEYIAKMNDFSANCWSTVATLAVPKGFPFKFMCNWRTGCGLNELNGLTCPAKPPSFGITATFDFDLSFGGTIARLDYAIAEALGGINMADVNVTLADTPTRNRRLATVTYNVEIGTKTTAEADLLAAAVKKPKFEKGMTAQCNTCTGFAVSAVTATVVIPPMGGYVVPKYQSGKAVVQFHAWSPMKKDEKWEIDKDTAAGKKYLTNIAGISVFCMIIATLAMLIYWIFLCGHNCKCCKRVCGCCNQKGAWGGEKVARPLLALMFFVTLIIMCTSTTGATHFKDGLADVGDVLGKVADKLDTLEASTGKIFAAGATMIKVGGLASVKNFKEGGTGCRDKDVGPMFLDIGKIVSDAGTEISDLLSGQGDKVRKMKKQLTEEGPPLLDALVMATIALFVPWTLFGLIGVGLGSKAPRMSDCFLNVVAALGLLILWIVAIMLAVELAIGVVLSDFCFSDPLVAMNSLINQQMDGDQAKLFSFYMDCDEGRGNKNSILTPPVVEAELMAENILILGEGVSGTACSESTMDMLTLPGTGAVPNVISALATVKSELSCQNMNPLFVQLTHDGICESAVNGLLALFNTHAVAGVFMLFTLHYASFVRPYMNKKEVGVMPEQPAADEKAAAGAVAPASDAGY